MGTSKIGTVSIIVAAFISLTPFKAQGQFQMTWVDIGEMQSRYSDGGAHTEGQTLNQSLEWPAILRRSGHYRAKAYWIGVKDWIDETGEEWDYRVARVGLRHHGENFFTSVESRLVAKYEDTDVRVDGFPAKKNLVVVHEVDSKLPADRMLYQRYRSILGIETERWVYAYANEWHDDYHIIRRRMTNTGNTDSDPEIELAGQTLNDVMFFNMYRWTGREQAAWHGSAAQTWGKFNMIDVVGDGNEEYPVDFMAIYLWAGHDQDFQFEWNSLGSPMLQVLGRESPGDTVGRLAGMSMQGRVILHADASPSDSTFDATIQPSTFGWVAPDRIWAGDGVPERDLYELVIRTRENPLFVRDGSSRMYPHYADRIEPSGNFWNSTEDPSFGRQGGHAPSIGYGPYQMAVGDDIEIVEAEGAAGLSYKAATDIGTAYKESGFDDELQIPFDANGDGVIDDRSWNYDVYDNGSELLTKNQWFLTSRDSMFQFMYKARDVWNASRNMSKYPIMEPPRPPARFEVDGRPDQIELRWESMPGAADPESWEVYRTSDYVDKLPYAHVATLPGSARQFNDDQVIRGVEYFYYLQAVGSPTPIDLRALSGTPDGQPLRSGRYYTQTYRSTKMTRRPGAMISDFRIVPNPLNLASDESVRFFVEGDPTRSRVDFLDIPGQATITIYTEIGEFIKRIEHTDGSGFATWDLTTASRQPIVSGIYLVRVVDNDSGAADIKKLVLIK